MREYTPQIIMIAIFAMNFTINLMKHGQPRQDKYNVFSVIIDTFIEISILKWGGFF